MVDPRLRFANLGLKNWWMKFILNSLKQKKKEKAHKNNEKQGNWGKSHHRISEKRACKETGFARHANISWRTKCLRCNESVVGVCDNAPRRGDWLCDAGVCKAHNFANRRFCFKCGSVKITPFGVVDTATLFFLL